MGRILGVALIVWPVASALLLTIRWAGRALYRSTRRRRSRTRCPNCPPNKTQPAVNDIPTGSPTSNTHRTTAHTPTPHTAETTNATTSHRSHPMPSNYPRSEPR